MFNLLDLFDKSKNLKIVWDLLYFLREEIQYSLPILYFGVLILLFVFKDERILARISRSKYQLKFLNWGAYLVLSIIFLIPIQYLFFDKIMDHGESHVSVVSWIVWRGQELYPDLIGPYDYGNFYGPYSYFWFGIIPRVFGPSFLTFKLNCILLAAANFYFVFILAGRNWIKSVIFFGAIAAFGPYFFWLRPDSQILLTVLLSYVGLLKYENGDRKAIWWIAALIGIGVNLKIQSILYFSPLLWVLLRQKGLLECLKVGAFSILVFGLPFLLPWVSFQNFIDILTVAVDQGRQWPRVYQYYIPYFLMIAIPVAVNAYTLKSVADNNSKNWGRGDFIDFCALLFFGLVASIIAAKPGAGYYQFMPFLPAVIYFSRSLTLQSFLNQPIWARAFVWVYVVFFVLHFGLNQYLAIREMRGMAKLPVVQDLKDVEIKYPDKKIAIGWGDNESQGDRYNLSFYRGYFVWKGNPYFFDLGIRMDMILVGRPEPSEALNVLRECRIDLWLIQKNERPFEMRGWISGDWMTHRRVYSEPFIEAFHSSYEKVGSSLFYDLWLCKTKTD